MVRALLKGERSGSLLQVLILVAVIIVGATCVGLALSARHSASHAIRVQQRMTAAFNSYQREVLQACQIRNRKLRLVNDLEVADIKLQRTVIAIERDNPFIDSQLRQRRVNAYTLKMLSDEKFLAAPMPDCSKLVPTVISQASIIPRASRFR